MDREGLSVTCFGTPEVVFKKNRIKFRSRKVLALFLYLLIEEGWQSREQLIALLWPHADAKRGRLSLRGAIAQLRQSLKPAGEYLLLEQDWVTIDRSQPLDFDLNHLKSALASDATIEEMERGSALPPAQFFAGFSIADARAFEDWVIVQREGWQQRLDTVLIRLCQHYLDSLQSEKAIRVASDWLARSPYNESAYRTTMEAQALLGNRTAALQSYDACVVALDKELALSPSPETIALAERIRNNEIRSDQRAWPGSGEGSDEKNRPQPLPYVGRAEIQTDLVTYFRQAARSEPQTVALIGEAGVGKTQTAIAFQNWLQLQPDNPDIVTGRAFEMGGHLPYQPLVNGLRNRLELENAPEDLLTDLWLAELSQLLPELRDRYPDLPSPMLGEPQVMKARIYEGVTLLLHALAERRPTLVVLDDLQWADEGTLDLLAYANGRFRDLGSRLLLLITVRQEALLATNHPVSEWLANVERVIPLHRQTIGLLKESDLVDMLIRLAPHNRPETIQSFATLLYQQTNGLPFYLSAILQMLFEDKVLASSASTIDLSAGIQWIRGIEHPLLPQSVKIVVSSRLQRQSENGRLLLIALAILGRNSSFDQLCAVAQLSEEEGLIALEKLLESRLINEENGRFPYLFSHDIVRTIVYTQTGEARRRIYHRRAFDQLVREEAAAAQLAYQANAAQLHGPAFHYAVLAGKDALANYATTEALAHFDHAYALSQELDLKAADLGEMYQHRGGALEQNHAYVDALANYTEMLDIADAHHSLPMKLSALLAQAMLYNSNTDLANAEKGKATIEAAVSMARHLADRKSEAKALWCRMLLAYFREQDFAAAQRDGEAALTLARQYKIDEQAPFILNDLVRVYYSQGEIARALQLNLEARQLWQQLDNRSMLVDNLNLAAGIQLIQGQFEQAMVDAQLAGEIAQSINNLWNQAASLRHRGMIHTERGEVGLAIQRLTEAKVVSERAKSTLYWMQSSAQLALIYADLGSVEKGIELCAGGLNYADATGWSATIFHAVQAYLFLKQGEIAEAQASMAKVNVAETDLFYIYPYFLFVVRCEVAQHAGDGHHAAGMVDRLIAFMEQTGYQLGLPNLYLLKGQHLKADGKLMAACRLWRKGYEKAKAINAPWIGWRLAVALAGIELELELENEKTTAHREARTTLEMIIENIPEGELRASFLALPAVVTLLN